MHISEGVLNTPTLIAGYAIALPTLAYTMRSLNTQNTLRTAAFSALFLVVSFIHIPLGPSSIHLLFIGILGAVLGRCAFVAIFVALFIQGLMFGFGGIFVLGVNASIMGYAALFTSFIYNLKIKSKFFPPSIRYFLAGFLGVLLGTIFLFFTMWANHLFGAGITVFIGNIPLMIVEGFISLVVLKYLEKLGRL